MQALGTTAISPRLLDLEALCPSVSTDSETLYDHTQGSAAGSVADNTTDNVDWGKIFEESLTLAIDLD
jgi:hypothetical protein